MLQPPTKEHIQEIAEFEEVSSDCTTLFLQSVDFLGKYPVFIHWALFFCVPPILLLDHEPFCNLFFSWEINVMGL